MASAVYLLAEDGKRGTNAILVEPPFFGDRECTYNAQRILDTVLKATSSRLYKRLRQVGDELDCNSTLETISALIERHGPDPDDEYIRQLFSDCRRSEFGRPVDQVKYKQKKNKSHD